MHFIVVDIQQQEHLVLHFDESSRERQWLPYSCVNEIIRGWIRTCSSRMWESYIWCWCMRLHRRASQAPPKSPGSAMIDSRSCAVHSQSYRRYWLNNHTTTSLVLEHIEYRQYLTVVGHQGLSNHLAGQHQFLYLFERSAHDLVIFGRKCFWVNKRILLIGIISCGSTGKSLFGLFSISSSVPWLARNL